MHAIVIFLFSLIITTKDLTIPHCAMCIPIERVQNSSNIPAVKFLGLYFDTELNFKHHIKTICTRVSRALYMLRTCKNFLSVKSLKILYYSIVHCHLIYGNQIWGCPNASLITEFYRKQKAAVRIISNRSYRAHTEPIFKQFNILPLPSLIEFFKLQFMQRCIQGHLPPSFNNVWFTNETRRTDDFFYTCFQAQMLWKYAVVFFP